MLVFGDVPRRVLPAEACAALAAVLARVAAMPPGVARHGALVEALIAAGGLAQGLADAAQAARGEDAPNTAADAATALTAALAQAVAESWRSGFARVPALPCDSVAALAALPLPVEVALRRPEGFAFYAVYPEAYLAAAEAAGLGPADRAVGIRSIGTVLGAMVAAAAGAPPPATLRPVGHPFAREVRAAPAAVTLPEGPAARVAVVDEGPGLSGSSFGAVADWLEARGVAPERLAFFPSHRGAPGPRASARHRARWDRAARHVVEFDDLVLGAANPAHRLEHWVAELTGPAAAPLRDLSGGAWRALRHGPEAAWPPAHPWQERRKFLLRAGGADWLLRFAGLGEGARKLERARALHAAGFTPEVFGHRHGFLVERWHGEARGLDGAAVPRDTLVARVGAYLGFRARHFAAPPDSGASLAALLEMARHNLAQALGAEAARALDRWTPAALARLAPRVRRVETDNRLHAWEWLVLPDGRVFKADALDHHAGHDLVGCQDMAWDVVGAAVELDLPDAAVAEAVARESGRAPDPELCALLRPCYLAFQLGYWTLAAAASGPEERRRLEATVARYAAALRP